MTERQNAPPPLTYAEAGVDIDAGNALVERIKPLVAATKRAGSNPNLGGFGGLFDLAACGYEDPVLVAATDGVGTKLKLAIDAQMLSGVGIDLVAMCVNDLIVQGAEPLFFLDYFATGVLSVAAGAEVVAGIADGCQRAHAALIGGETAEMPGLYQDGEFDLAGFCVGAVERREILPRQTLADGDVLLALASSGLHSNGYSLVRQIVARSGEKLSAPAPFAPEKTLSEVLLEPTRIYVRPFLAALKSVGGLKAAAHITGGGLSENIPRILSNGLKAELDLASWTPPSVFKWLSDEGNVAPSEMLRTFNCGVGMVLVVDPHKADEIAEFLTDQGEIVWPIGRLAAPLTGQVDADLSGATAPLSSVSYQGALCGIGAP